MPVTPTYPGVYIEEISSGVRTITGVSTSVAAFIGAAKRGPINTAVRILSFGDYERRFGGLDAESELSYAVRQFFLNSGSEAWVVRIAKDVNAAFKELLNTSSQDSLKITAVDEGKSGNNIQVKVDYKTSNPASTFNLAFNYISPDNPQDNFSEKFENLSLNSKDSRYLENVINGISQLVKVERTANLDNIGSIKGTSRSGQISNISQLIDTSHNQLQVVVNGSAPVTVIIDNVLGNNDQDKLDSICQKITEQVAAIDCVRENNTILLTSKTTGKTSSVRVLPGLINDVSSRLKLGTLNGGVETDAVAQLRPAEKPDHGILVSGTIQDSDLTDVPTNKYSLQISLDGYNPDTISIDQAALSSPDLATNLNDLAGRIQASVRSLKLGNLAYTEFTCTVNGNKLILASGTRGAGSSVFVDKASNNDLAETLKLTKTLATSTPAKNETLQNGNESAYTENDAYNLLFGKQSERKGIYALEAVDLFNLLCLPGITDGSVLIDAAAYCQERRAFLIADAPKNADTPAEIEPVISGTALPKTEYGAVYYPWIYTADPLNNGKLRLSAPSGTIAGLYARTDSTRGIWKAPAGTDATLVGVQKVAYILTDKENGTLNPLGVNCLRIFPIYGAVAWGARTLRGADQIGSEYKYIPVRRTALYIEESLYRGLKWVVFEPNDEALWAQIRLNVGAFLNNLFRQGAFQGKSPREAYFVKCDKETTTQNDINLGIVNIVVGFAPLKPAEFVIIKVQQIAGEIAV